MKVGVDRYQDAFVGMVNYHNNHNREFKEILDKNDIPNFRHAYYPQPQYPIDVISYILTKESHDVFTIDLYIPLTQFVSGVQRLMSVESKLVEVSE